MGELIDLMKELVKVGVDPLRPANRLYKKAKELENKRAYEAAIGQYQKCIEEAKKDGNTVLVEYSYLSMGMCYDEMKNLPESEKSFLKALDIPSAPRDKILAHFHISFNSLYEAEPPQIDKALSHIMDAIEIEEKENLRDNLYTQCIYIAGQSLGKLGRNEKAVEMYEKVVELTKDSNPSDCTDGYAAIIGLLLCSKDYSRALEYATKLKNYLYVALKNPRSSSYFKEKRTDQSVEFKMGFVHQIEATCNEKMGLQTEATESLLKAAAFYSKVDDESWSYAHLGYVHERLGNLDKALKSINTASRLFEQEMKTIKFDPNNDDFKFLDRGKSLNGIRLKRVRAKLLLDSDYTSATQILESLLSDIDEYNAFHGPPDPIEFFELDETKELIEQVTGIGIKKPSVPRVKDEYSHSAA